MANGHKKYKIENFLPEQHFAKSDSNRFIFTDKKSFKRCEKIDAWMDSRQKFIMMVPMVEEHKTQMLQETTEQRSTIEELPWNSL